MTARKGKTARVRARAVLRSDVFHLVKKLDDPDATVAAVASTVLDAVEDGDPDRIIRVGRVVELVGLSKSEIYRRLREGLDFPVPLDLGGTGRRRRVGWRESEVRAWLRQRVRAR